MLMLIACTSPAGGREAAAPGEHQRLDSESRDTAYALIERAVQRMQLAGLDSSAVEFRFREKFFRYQRDEGRYRYERWWTDTTSGERIHDVLDNEGVQRRIDGKPIELSDKQRRAYAAGVNSVIYFAFLPWALLDDAVQARYEGRDTIRGRPLDRIAVSFAAEGGGGDYEDHFVYWFSPDGSSLPYLAYSEKGNKEPRFREAYNGRLEGGVQVRDYRNYAVPQRGLAHASTMGERFEAGELVLLSLIELRDVRRVPRVP